MVGEREEHEERTAGQSSGPCPVCDGEPCILVVMRHPGMLRFTRELLRREFGCWAATEAHQDERLATTLERVTPDLMVVDAGSFPNCCLAALDRIDRSRVIVIGPEPDESYRSAALAAGAGAWLPRDRVADELASEMRRLLGCTHAPCPPRHGTERFRRAQRSDADALRA